MESPEPQSSRDAILASARREIERAGILGLRVADVASGANSSITQIYRFFKNRDGLLARAGATHRPAPDEVKAPRHLGGPVPRDAGESIEIQIGAYGSAEARSTAVPGSYPIFVERLASNHQVAFENLPPQDISAWPSGPLNMTVNLANGTNFVVNLHVEVDCDRLIRRCDFNSWRAS